MSTLIRRIIFIAIILGIIYWIYWLIDRKWADDLREDVINTTQKTVESLGGESINQEDIIEPVVDGTTESLWSYEEILPEKNIVVTDPEIKEPVVTQSTNTITKTTTTKTTTKKTTTSSSNILFQLFK
jgi:hypothetical protein